MSLTDQPPGLRQALRHPTFRLELIGYSLVSASMGVATVVVSVAMFRRGGTPGWATLGVVARVAPFVLLSAFSGAIADRHDQRRVLQLAFLAQAAMAGVLALTVSGAPLVIVAAIGFLANTLWTISYPSMAAVVPRTMDIDELSAANGLLSTIESLAWIAGPGLGGLLITTSGLRPAIAVQAGLAITGAAFATLALRSGRTRADENAAFTTRAPDEAHPPLLHSMRAGIRAIVDTPVVHHPLALMLVANLVYGAMQVLMLVAAWKRLGMSEGGYGALCAGLGAGAFSALLVVNRMARFTRPELALAGAVLLSGAPLALLSITSLPAIGIVLLGVSGLGLVLTEVLALTTLQQNTPADRMAGVFGLLDSLTIGAALLGSITAAPLIHAVGLEWALVVAGAMVPVAAIVTVPQVVRVRSKRRTTVEADDLPLPAGAASPHAAVRSFVINS
jgi:predicted MFS family arabinose efflux permease